MSDILPLRQRLDRGEPVQVVAFRVSDEYHACDVLCVDEVITGGSVHALPDSPDHVQGVMFLRGTLVPVLDLSRLLGLPPLQTEDPSVLVLKVAGARAGIQAEMVNEVVTVAPGDVRPAPSTASEHDRYVLGIARVRDMLLTLVDPAEILTEYTSSSR